MKLINLNRPMGQTYGGNRMKKLLLLLAMALILALNGCAITTKAVVTEGQEVNFERYQLVRIEIVDNVKTDYSKSGIEMFEGLLRQRIGTVLPYSEKGAFGEKLYKGLGKTIVDKDEDLLIKISIPYFKPDSKALRMLVGFGSGKGGLEYEATFACKDKIIATLNGGKSYGDVGSMVWEPDSTVYRGSESTQILMVSHSVNEIVEFIRSNCKKYQGN